MNNNNNNGDDDNERMSEKFTDWLYFKELPISIPPLLWKETKVKIILRVENIIRLF